MPDVDPFWIRWPYARVRREWGADAGEVSYFLVQLEYDVEATPTGKNNPDWQTVARFDHNPDTEEGHDIREEGLHLDVYKHGEKHKVKRGFPPVPPGHAIRYCERYFERHAGRLLEQFERWHGLYGPWRT